METHKHKGIVKCHPITQVHKDKNVQKWHNLALKGKVTKLTDLFRKEKVIRQTNKTVVCTVDGDYISIDLPHIEQKGIRITGVESGRVKVVKGRVNGLQLDK